MKPTSVLLLIYAFYSAGADQSSGLVIEEQHKEYRELKIGSNPLAGSYYLPHEYNWSGSQTKFTELHARFPGANTTRSCITREARTTCYTEQKRSLLVKLKTKLPSYTQSVNLKDTQSLRAFEFIDNIQHSVYRKITCLKDLHAILPPSGAYNVTYGLIYYSMLVKVEEYENSSLFNYFELTAHLPIRLPGRKCDVIYIFHK
ncbi:hypothetical protein DSO57_1019949 [Entomophthora muscae]|uniref:Uncharacterized protein n=1 Tax=Entomophthora muscae TaxID=34485 RepID=A0ACC2RUV2_9FUNG|nr:hypothetical protein DSO57_1019949 [Entomophthora muscae]